jgi:glutamate 5-kinase
VKARGDLRQVRRLVVKIGSRLLRDDLDGRVAMLADEAAAFRARGGELVIVTSGAIALGVHGLGLSARPTELPGLQAAAAVGQGRLMHVYQTAFAARGLPIGQVLLTHDDVADRRRYLNARRALVELQRLGAVPVVNENDTVSVDEIKFGDNDRLAALVTSLVGAELLILLTDVDGLYDGDPRDPTAKLVPEVDDVEATRGWAGASGSNVGTGGMASKIEAAAIAGRFGVATAIASGRADQPIRRLLDGETLGTLVWPRVDRLAARKHWIAYALKARGQLRVDAGARTALIDSHRSLLPRGVRAVEGDFGAGDPVELCDEAGHAFARGLCALDADELRRVLGHRGDEIASVLGYPAAGVVVHRDDLVIL